MKSEYQLQISSRIMTGERFQLALIRPRDFVFVEAFREIIESLQQGFAELGIPCRHNVNRIEAGAVPVILGSHHLNPDAVAKLPPETILYNLEQLAEGFPWFSEEYINLLRRFQVWDFSTHNIDILRRHGVSEVTHVPIGFSPILERIPRIDEDLDVLFYGIMSPRRKAILEEIGAAGIRLAALNGVFGAERDAWIARSKIVLNLHTADGGVFEAARVSYLLANSKMVVSECNRPEEIDADLAPGLKATPRSSIVGTCRQLLADPDERRRISACGRELMLDPSRRTAQILSCALGIGQPD